MVSERECCVVPGVCTVRPARPVTTSETFNSVVSVARGQRSQQTSKSTLDTFHLRLPSCLTVCVIYIKLFDDTHVLEQTDTPNEAGGGGKRGRGSPDRQH